MNRNRFGKITTGLFVALGTAALTGCSVFQSSRQIDMNPFAENTAAMFAEAAKVGRPPTWNYLKPYKELPELQAIRVKSAPVIIGLRGIVMYSNQLVALNMSSKPDKEKNKLLARYFRDAEAKVGNRARFDSVGVSTGMIDTVYRNIEAAETFREGILAASPLVNAVVLAMIQRLEEIGAELPNIAGVLDKKIEEDYAAKRQNYDDLVRLQTQLHHAATLLYDSREGDRAALKSLFEVEPSMRDYFANTDKPSLKEFDAADQALTGRLERIEKFIHQLDYEKATYIGKERELEELRINFDARVKIARDAVMFWAQSHRNLGAGIEVPPLIDVAGIAGGLSKKVLPIP